MFTLGWDLLGIQHVDIPLDNPEEFSVQLMQVIERQQTTSLELKIIHRTKTLNSLK